MAASEAAEACRQNLMASLMMTNALTRDDDSHMGRLLCAMNDVLKAMAYSNFNRQACLPAIGRLYGMIEDVCVPIINSGQHKQLFYFARSFAVMAEDTVCSLDQEEQTRDQSSTPEATSPTAVVHVKTGKSRINMWRISDTVKKQQLVDLLTQIDPTFELSYPKEEDGTQRGFAFARFETNEIADEAVRRLKGTPLNGKAISVQRTEFWFNNGPPSPTTSTASTDIVRDSVDVESEDENIDCDEVD